MGRESSSSSSSKSKTPDIWVHLERLEAIAAAKAAKAAKEPEFAARATPAEGKEESDVHADDEKKQQQQHDEAENGGADALEDPHESSGDADKQTQKISNLLANTAEITPRNSWMLFVGPREVGKSSLIAQFLTPGKVDEKPKPTVALEYTYGRRSNASGERKDLCQVWELGGGDKLLNLATVVLEQKEPGLVVICVDLSAPEDAFGEATKWMANIRKRSRRVPIMLLGTKYDRFENEDGLKRKALAQALRYAACVNKAGLVFVSKRDKTALNYYRALLSHFAFATEKKKSFYVDPAKPIVVAPGRDSLAKIGLPPGVTESSHQTDIETAWRALLQDYFPRRAQPESRQEAKDAAQDEDSSNEDSQAEEALRLEPESIVDAYRQKKDLELQRYRARSAAVGPSSPSKPRRSTKDIRV